MFRKRLVNFLFGDGVLGELITANEAAPLTINAAANKNLFMVVLDMKSASIS